MKQLSLILIGGGDRGSSYLKYLQEKPEHFKLVAIAEPVRDKREFLRKMYNVPSDMCFEGYQELLRNLLHLHLMNALKLQKHRRRIT